MTRRLLTTALALSAAAAFAADKPKPVVLVPQEFKDQYKQSMGTVHIPEGYKAKLSFEWDLTQKTNPFKAVYAAFDTNGPRTLLDNVSRTQTEYTRTPTGETSGSPVPPALDYLRAVVKENMGVKYQEVEAKQSEPAELPLPAKVANQMKFGQTASVLVEWKDGDTLMRQQFETALEAVGTRTPERLTVQWSAPVRAYTTTKDDFAAFQPVARAVFASVRLAPLCQEGVAHLASSTAKRDEEFTKKFLTLQAELTKDRAAQLRKEMDESRWAGEKFRDLISANARYTDRDGRDLLVPVGFAQVLQRDDGAVAVGDAGFDLKGDWKKLDRKK